MLVTDLLASTCRMQRKNLPQYINLLLNILTQFEYTFIM